MMFSRGMIVAFSACAVLAWRGTLAAGESAPERDAARVEVAAAERAVEEASRQRALWTTARDAMQDARAALKKGDFGTAIRLARFAKEQAELGISQLRYPRFPDRG